MILERIQNLVNLDDGITDENYSEILTRQQNIDKLFVTTKLSGHLLLVSSKFTGFQSFNDNLRGKGIITDFSPSSARRMRTYLRESVSAYSVFITLTYPMSYGDDGIECKRHLSNFLRRMRRYSNDRTFSAFWFLEFQKRGAIHFHIFCTHRYPKEWVARSWYEVCGTDDKRHLVAGTRIETIRGGKRAICAYAAKYAAKAQQKSPPKEFGWVGRFWGVAGVRETVSADIVFPACVGDIPGVVESINRLDSMLEDMVFYHHARVLQTKTGETYGYYISNDEALSRVDDLLRWINAKYQLNLDIISGRKRYRKLNPELFEDLSDA